MKRYTNNSPIKATDIPPLGDINEIAYHFSTSHLGGGAASEMNKAMMNLLNKSGLGLAQMTKVLDANYKHEGMGYASDVAMIWSDYNELMDEMMSYGNEIAKWVKEETEIEAAMNKDMDKSFKKIGGRIKNNAPATGLKREALLIALDMRGDSNDPEESFMLRGEIFDNNGTLETIDDQYGTTFVYGYRELVKEWINLNKKAEEFAASLSAFANNELE